jgi:hypothetical protein
MREPAASHAVGLTQLGGELMTHDSPDPHGDGTMGSEPTQGIFIGWLAVGLLVVMAIFTLVVISAGARFGFS